MENKLKQTATSLVFTLLIFTTFSSCKKEKQEPYKNIHVGYIYNSNDNTPFANTKFKIYNFTQATGASNSQTEESFFNTDNNGRFNHTTEMYMGELVWPSYFEGAAYAGPPPLGDPIKWEQDTENKINTYFYDTLYTTPYQ